MHRTLTNKMQMVPRAIKTELYDIKGNSGFGNQR